MAPVTVNLTVAASLVLPAVSEKAAATKLRLTSPVPKLPVNG